MPRPWAAHFTRGNMYLLHAALAPRVSLTYITPKNICIQNKQERRTQFRQQEGKEGGREGGKEGRMAGRKKQRPSSKMLHATSNSHMTLSKSCKSHAIYKCWFQNVGKTVWCTVQVLAATRCKHMQLYAMCFVPNVIPCAALIFRKPPHSIQLQMPCQNAASALLSSNTCKIQQNNVMRYFFPSMPLCK